VKVYVTRMVVWVLVTVAELVCLYGITCVAYHSSILPYQIENGIQRSGLWRIFGEKTYATEMEDEYYWVDPRIDLVDEIHVDVRYDGYLVKKTETALYLGKFDQQQKKIDVTDTPTFYLRKNGEDTYCNRCTNDTLNVGSWIEVLNVNALNPETGVKSVVRTSVYVEDTAD